MKNKVISLFLAATMVLSLCPATVRAQTVSEEFSAKVAEAAETEAVEGTADPTEEPVVTGNEDTAKTDTPQAVQKVPGQMHHQQGRHRKKQKLSVREKMKTHRLRRRQKKQIPPGIPGRKTKN